MKNPKEVAVIYINSLSAVLEEGEIHSFPGRVYEKDMVDERMCIHGRQPKFCKSIEAACAHWKSLADENGKIDSLAALVQIPLHIAVKYNLI